MSAKNPFTIYKQKIRQLRNKAYHIKKIREPNEQAEYIFDKLYDEIGPSIIRAAQIAWIRDFVTNRYLQLDSEKPDLFGDLDYQFVLRNGKASTVIELGDVGLDEIETITQQKIDNINRARAEADRWKRACNIIQPLLRKHPDWKWKDAVDWLSKHGGLPMI